MDRFPGYESLLSRIEHKKAQVKSQLSIEHCHLVDEFAVFVLDQFNKCLDDVPSTAQDDDDHFGTDGTVTRAPTSDIQIDNQQINPTSAPSTAANNHNREATSGSISSEQNVSPVSPPTPVTQSTIPSNIEVKVEDVSDGQSIQVGEFVKKEEDDGGEYVMDCDCGECEICRVKREMKEERDESGESEQMEDWVKLEIMEELEDGEIMHIKEEEEEDGEVEGERPNKIRRMDRVLGNVPVGSLSPSTNAIPINVEYIDDQVASSSTNPITIEDHTQPSQPVSIPLPTSIVTPSSSSTQHVNETIRDELLNAEPMIDNVGFEVRAEEFDREQTDHDISTLNQLQQDDEETEDDSQNDEEEGNETIEYREDPSAGDEHVPPPAENFLKRIEPDEFGNKFECDYQACGKRMKTKRDLIDHIRTHTGEKPFKCSVEGCDRAFVQKGQLKAHLSTHSGTRPFVCSWPSCEARFRSKSILTAHLLTHTGRERPFECDQCDVTFIRLAHLVSHRRTHTGERPFHCDQCDAAFTRNGDLVTHLRLHTGARPFVCTWPECGQAFYCSSNLYSHSRVHSNERHVCDVTGCTKVYKHKETLRLHQKAKHN